MPVVYTVDIHYIRNGEYMLAAYCYDSTSPRALVWGRCLDNDGKKKTFHVSDSYVPLWARRQGARTAINSYLFKEKKVDVIITSNGSPEGGKGFLEGSGYVVDRRTGEYVLTKSKHRRIQKGKKSSERD